ncbi:hypothetical protein OSB04_013760 [Centaurea solstitialis]|uniref:PHD-type domain-containing protein n=1 Tax=Centaurea solstitialis TaxID=347529 RepID=A0AA38WRG1_9ASTR|nr:hypothetical protein OSB04_013760 [Centaurea solstitialis]
MHYKNRTSAGIRDKRVNAHRYKKLFQVAGEKVKVSQGQTGVSDASNEEHEVPAKKSCFSSKRRRKRQRQRVDSDSEELCFSNPESGNRPSSISPMDDGECETELKTVEPSDGERGSEGFCAICMASGELLLCCGQGCGKSFHRSCLDPPLTSTPPGAWHCESCNKKKNKSRVHSASKGTEFDEYWIPVHLSCMQIEQYCSLLHSNLEALSSCLRNNSFHDILIQTQKCCDHPYLVDPTLRKYSKRDVSIDPLDAEINVSSKLQLLDKLLSEIKRCGLRVLVLFQSVVSSERITIGDILDDLVDRRFGQDSYVRIPRKILSRNAREKKKQDLNMFNDTESGKFICLLDYHTCHSSIKLSHVDVVVLFNGDWNPLTNLKALQKITIDSRSQRLRVLRLYSSFTIEEKALILAKQGAVLESNLNQINWSTCQQVLAWGASYLFSKLQSYTPEPSFLDDLLQKLSSLLLNKEDDNDLLNGSVIVNAQLRDGAYARNILLFGENEAHVTESFSIDEYLLENEPLAFWTNLVKGTPHRLKNPFSSSRLSRRLQKQSGYPSYWFQGFESEGENDTEVFDKVVNNAATPPCAKTKLTRKRKANSETEQSKLAGRRHGHSGEFSENPNGNACVPGAPENVSSACRETNTISSRKVVTKFEQQNEGCTQIRQENLDDTGGCPRSQFLSGQRMSPPLVQRVTRVQSNEQFNRSLMQPAAQVPSTCIFESIALDSSRSCVRQCQNNQPSQTLPVRPPTTFQSSSVNPLEAELERIAIDREQVTKLCQEKTLLLRSECEKEMSEIQKKYDALIEESEACFIDSTEGS